MQFRAKNSAIQLKRTISLTTLTLGRKRGGEGVDAPSPPPPHEVVFNLLSTYAKGLKLPVAVYSSYAEILNLICQLSVIFDLATGDPSSQCYKINK